MKFLLEIAHFIVVSVTGIVTVIVHGDISTRLIKMQEVMIKTLIKIGLSLTNLSPTVEEYYGVTTNFIFPPKRVLTSTI